MNPAWIAAIIGAIGLLLGIVAWAIGLTFQAGRHSKSMEIAQTDIAKLQTKVEGHERAISAWDQALHVLEEVRKDVKSLMTGQVQLPRPRSRRDNPEA